MYEFKTYNGISDKMLVSKKDNYFVILTGTKSSFKNEKKNGIISIFEFIDLSQFLHKIRY